MSQYEKDTPSKFRECAWYAIFGECAHAFRKHSQKTFSEEVNLTFILSITLEPNYFFLFYQQGSNLMRLNFFVGKSDIKILDKKSFYSIENLSNKIGRKRTNLVFCFLLSLYRQRDDAIHLQFGWLSPAQTWAQKGIGTIEL